MTARVLVVDDILPNVKLLEAKLNGEYFDVITATSGAEGIEKAMTQGPDIILLDVMMPGMDGFEACRRLKADPATAHIPVIMVTALTDGADRVRGLEAGADDFLSKPVNDVALMARVRSLVRLKMTVDEWRIRETTASQFGFPGGKGLPTSEAPDKARILVIEDRDFETEKFVDTLRRDDDIVMPVRTGEQGIALAQQNEFDLITVSLGLSGEDGLRLCSHLRSNERTRSVPILMVGEDGDLKRIAQGLEIGAHDYILRPVDRNELLARVRTQVRRKRYQDRLRANYEMSLSLALTDSLTGLFNRRYLMVHLDKLLKKNAESRKTLCVLTLDIDHFKKINDSYGHGVGDEVLRIFADRVGQRLRGFDLVARLGGEEFVVVLPDVNRDMAVQVAERLRTGICGTPFRVAVPQGQIEVSMSVGAALIEADDVSVEDALKRSDDELYKAKENGRNRCYFAGIGCVTEPLPA
jgi:two-component system, cell cycle response regulator